MPTPLITLTCPNCGGALESAGQDSYVCPYCGAVHRLRDHPDWMKQLQDNLDQLKSELTDVQANSRQVASAQALPGLLVQSAQLTDALKEWVRVIFVSLLVFGIGFFLKRWLVFSPDSGWIRFLPTGLMLLGGGVLIYVLVRTILLTRQRAQLNHEIERCRDAIRKIGA